MPLTSEPKVKLIRVVARISINELPEGNLSELQQAMFALKERFPRATVDLSISEPFRVATGR